MPPLPKDFSKIVLRPRGGLNISKIGTGAVADAIVLAAGVKEEEAMQDIICSNLQQNIMVASTPDQDRASRYLKVKQIDIGGKVFEVSAYAAAPHDTCKGVIRGIPVSDTQDILTRKIVNANNPLALQTKRIKDTGTIIIAFEGHKFNWSEYLSVFLPVEVSPDEPLVVYSVPYLRQVGQILVDTDQRTLHNFAVWRLVNYLLAYLDGEYAHKRNAFRKVMLGVSADKVRWNHCVELANKKMGMAVGALFIRDNFDPHSKETALEMIHNIREAFNELLKENDWMDTETRKVAEEKANAMNERIGYPELLTNPYELSKEYDSLVVHEDLYLDNVFNILQFEATRNQLKLRQPVNKEKWTTEPAVVNAFYNPNKNDIVFPAGILQPLFYSHHFPKSLNYGGIGVVIGHEITHGFDDKGRQFDKDGNLKPWWNNKTVQTFRERAQCMVDQYSSYVLEDVNLNINGKMTQGENIADNGGLKQAYRAYKKWVKQHGEEPLLPGINLTHDQLFFLNYAQIWCGSMRPEEALNKIRTSVHCPGPIRDGSVDEGGRYTDLKRSFLVAREPLNVRVRHLRESGHKCCPATAVAPSQALITSVEVCARKRPIRVVIFLDRILAMPKRTMATPAQLGSQGGSGQYACVGFNELYTTFALAQSRDHDVKLVKKSDKQQNAPA
ncbi:hypothetical protein HPB51_009218 [Rhipicephalus microplus]|uniref:M13 family peptidase n=1 Tax=Rhipicephalus microplus TaxID=6941 RepID=A0A9J6EZR7_RHIMP|nr:hypothetical protein HPB51_009218 [Rhipicephalus microplus]